MARAMKDSGIEWIGQIPEQWEVIALNRILTCFGRIGFRGYTQEDLVDEGEGPITLSPTNIIDSKLSLKKCSYISWEKYYESPEIALNNGDIVFVKTASVGKCAIYDSDEKATVNPQFIVLKEIKSDRKFLYYSLISSVIQEPIQLSNFGSVIGTITQKQFLSYKICNPSKDEQLKIADFLDEKCASIDAVIEKTKASIEDYKKLKQAVITQAVTKGIRPNRKMKDSGVEWIGEIPEEWEVNRFGRVITVKSNLVNPDEYQDYPQIAPDNIKKGEACLLDNVKTVKEVGVISWNHLFFKGQIIYSKIRPMLNKVIIAPFDGLCSADMYPIETSQNVDYVVYMMLSDCFLSQVGLVTMNRVKMPKINQNELTNIIMPIPDIEEQKEITDYLKNKCKRIDVLIEKKEKELTEMEQLKKSLIYEYVTGKKGVPDCY